MAAMYPDKSGEEADEGTVAHAIAGEVLGTGQKLSSFLGHTRDNVYVDMDMIRHLSLYIDVCGSQQIGGIEQTMNAEYDGHTLTGTPDNWQFIFDDSVLRILDLKYGHGVVEVYENWQLLTYAFLVWEHLLRVYPGRFDMFKTIELVVVQPRANHPAGPVRRWSFDADLIRNYRNRVIDAMRRAAHENPDIATGAHCRYCPGLLACQGAAIAASYAIEYAGTLVHGKMSPGTLSYEMDLVGRAFKMLRDRQTALVEMGLALNKAGVVVPGWESRRDPGALAWNGKQAVAIGDLMDVDLRQPEKPVTPTQAINRKLLTEKQVQALASRSMGSPSFKRVDHARAKRILE